MKSLAQGLSGPMYHMPLAHRGKGRENEWIAKKKSNLIGCGSPNMHLGELVVGHGQPGISSTYHLLPPRASCRFVGAWDVSSGT